MIGVAIFGTFLATLRTLRGPVFFPLRVLAAGYTDLFRGLPLIIVLYLVGFGIPGLMQTRIPVVVLGTVALVLTYSAYVSEVIRAGIEAVHPSQRLAARSLGLSNAQTLRVVVLPQALRKVTPALMNDFVAMQKDVGLISVLGAVDAVRAAQIETAKFADFTPYVVAGVLFVLLAIPTIRLTDWWTRPAAPARAGGGDRMTGSAALRAEGIWKSFGETAVLRGISLELAKHEVVALIGPSGSGKSTLLRCLNLLERDRRRPDLARRRGHQRPPGEARRRARAVRRRLPELQPVPAPERARQRDAREPQGAEGAAGGGGGDAGCGCWNASGSPTRRASIRTGSPAASSSAPRSRGRSRPIPRCCCSTRSRARSTRNSSARCSSWCGSSPRDGATILMATHEMAFAREVAHRVVFLDGGVVVEQGPPAQLFGAPARAADARVPGPAQPARDLIRSATTLGTSRLRSRIVNGPPLLARSAAMPWMTAAAAASGASSAGSATTLAEWVASRAPRMPPSASPAPAVASQLGAASIASSEPSGDATWVVWPLSSTMCSRSAAAR